MRKTLPLILGAWLISFGQAYAQDESPPTMGAAAKNTDGEAAKKQDGVEEPKTNVSSVVKDLAIGYQAGYRVWGHVDFLLWQVKSAPIPIPLVTTGNPNVGFDPNLANTVNIAGAVGQQGTQVLLGGNPMKFPVSPGMRLVVGAWIEETQRLGLEGGGFLVQRVTKQFTAQSNQSGSPPLYFPIFSESAGAERAIPIADPLRQFSGGVVIDSAVQFGGAEANVICNFFRDPTVDFSLLVGFRYADLREKLQNHNSTTDLLFGNVTVLSDTFQTINQFYGGQLGGRFGFQRDWLSLGVTGKIAIGSIHQIVNVQGDITQSGPNPLVPPGPGTFPGGIFAQSSNIGRGNANPVSVPFSVIPSLEVKLGCQLTQHLRAFAGYDVIYWTQVLRPGNQMSHNVNLSQNAVLDPSGAGILVGPAQPALQVDRSDFWAQGLNLGIEFSF